MATTYSTLLNNTDNDALTAAGAAYNAAKARGDTAGMAAAHQQAETIRSNYGYSGGTDGSQYIKTNYIDQNGNSKTGTASMDYYTNLLDKLNTMYQSSVASNNTAYAAQLQATIANLEKQKQSLNLSYDNTAKQLYVDKRMAEKNAPQALSAQGYNGGLTESSLLGIQSGYEGNLLNNEQSRNQGLADLEYQKINAQSENAAEAAQAAQTAGENYYSNYASIMAQMAAQKNYEDEQAQATATTNQETYQNLLSYLYSTGMTPTAAQLSTAYGISAADAQNLLKSYTAKTAKSAGTSGSTSSTTSKSTSTATGSNYATYATDVSTMLKSGSYTKTQIKQAVYNAYKNGDITSSEYMKLMNQARG